MESEVKFTEEDLRNELEQFYPVIKERRPGGFTQEEAAKAWNVDIRTAGHRINALLKKGVFTRERAICEDGIKRYVYYKADKR